MLVLHGGVWVLHGGVSVGVAWWSECGCCMVE